jgi:hypothetical protein
MNNNDNAVKIVDEISDEISDEIVDDSVKGPSVLSENTAESGSEDFGFMLHLLEDTPWKGYKVKMRNVSIIANDDNDGATLAYEYSLPDLDVFTANRLYEDEEFKEYIGKILLTALEQSIEKGNFGSESNRNSDSNIDDIDEWEWSHQDQQ